VPRLFANTEEFAREALRSATPDLHIDDDGELLAFEPPDDLLNRLEVLPPGYLKEHKVAERMKVTFSKTLAQRKLDEAREFSDKIGKFHTAGEPLLRVLAVLDRGGGQ
jgi:hypothetical protein